MKHEKDLASPKKWVVQCYRSIGLEHTGKKEGAGGNVKTIKTKDSRIWMQILLHDKLKS